MRSTNERKRIAVLGSGSLAGWVCDGLTGTNLDLRVFVVARDGDKARAVCGSALGRVRSAGRMSFEPVCSSLENLEDIAATLNRLSPEVVLLCASTQTPWEARAAPSRWTALLSKAGFGVALPLHAQLATTVGRAVPAGALFLNACYPDAVNQVLHAWGIPVLAGVGNVASLAATLQARLRLPDQRRLRVLAHHAHLSPPSSELPEAEAWLDEQPVPDMGGLLARHRATDRKELNQVTGYATAQLVGALSTDAVVETNLPGPAGLPGGYPVRIQEGRITLRLPPSVREEDAVAANQRAALADGVLVDRDRVVFSDRARAEISAVAPDLAAGYRIADIDTVAADLRRLRERLRAQEGVAAHSVGL